MLWNISERKQKQMTNKTCAYCKQTKKISEFYVIKGKVDYYCKYCRTGHSMRSQVKNKDKKCIHCGIDKHYAKGYCRNCYTRNNRNGTPEILNVGQEVYPNRSTLENHRKTNLRIRYKLTPNQYKDMAKDGCHICGREKLPHKNLHVDHDHKHCNDKISCGLCVRGVLCDACNTAVSIYEMGQMRDDYRNKDKVMLYVAMHDNLISDRIKKYDKEQGNR